MADIDITDEDTEAPEPTPEEVEAFTPAAAMRALDEAERATSAANKAYEAAKKTKKRASAIALAVLEHYELESAKTRLSDGNKVLFYKEQFRTFNIASEAQFQAWEAKQAENYYERKTKLREQIFQDEMRRRDDDKQELPPGVVKVQFPKLKRKADAKRSTK